MDLIRIKDKIEHFKSENKKLFLTSSFQGYSIVLIHIISSIDKNIPIYFINTGYHFVETLTYRDNIAKLLSLNIKNVSSQIPKIQQIDSNSHLLYVSDPDYCCFINKVQPMDKLFFEYDVWINGIRKEQNEHRKTLEEIENAPNNTVRYHPLINWTKEECEDYIKTHKLPKHPLSSQGYKSIGCEPCTIKNNHTEDERGGRWNGLKKNECGLHTELIIKK
ncbi:MAG: phosphoadenosine phosphosulfate reductase [Bacteroidetes bacterium GWE2_29_8]|nr:MAG: phosphoadenosine phosphosulfate reductase [Bacteroidetes bacterium GWE2_29_8]OFY14121.1 MAG: phosphoadenosine phosphosulfate reductase [Bacteroidetes bacterium GWF2_29_10]